MLLYEERNLHNTDNFVLIGVGLFFGFYHFRFLYYERNGADKIANFISLPFLILLGLYILISEYVSTKNRWRFSSSKFIKQIFTTIISIALVHLVFVQPVISGISLFINANIGNQSETYIQGTVVDKLEFSSNKGSDYCLTIKDSNTENIYKFGTFGTETEKFELNDWFEMKMVKGSLGLMYIKN